MPSQFAMIVRSSETLAGYCGFFHHEVDSKMEIEIGYRLDSAFGTEESPVKLRAPFAIMVFAT